MNLESVKLRHLLLILMVLFVPYPNIILFGNDYLFLPMVIFILYFLTSIKKLKLLLQINSIKGLAWPLIFLWLIFLVSSLINYEPHYAYMMRSVLQRTLIYSTFFILLYNELHNNSQLQLSMQKTMVVSIFLMGFFYFLGIGVDYDVDNRLEIFDTNSNSLGVWAATVIVLALDLIVIQKARGLYFLYLVFAVILAFYLMTLTGSRKAILMLALGILIYFLFLNRSIWYKLIRLVPGILICILAYQFIMKSEVIVQRVNTELDNRDYGGRLPIWEATIDIIIANPILGPGIGETSAHLIRKLGAIRSTHNEFLTVLAYGGLFGLFFFVIFLIALLRKSLLFLRNRNNTLTSLPLSLLSMQVIFLVSAGGGLTTFYLWIIFAFIATKSEEDITDERII